MIPGRADSENPHPAVGDVRLHRWCRRVLTGAEDAKG
jgi:hypothetical protein